MIKLIDFSVLCSVSPTCSTSKTLWNCTLWSFMWPSLLLPSIVSFQAILAGHNMVQDTLNRQISHLIDDSTWSNPASETQTALDHLIPNKLLLVKIFFSSFHRVLVLSPHSGEMMTYCPRWWNDTWGKWCASLWVLEENPMMLHMMNGRRKTVQLNQTHTSTHALIFAKGQMNANSHKPDTKRLHSPIQKTTKGASK